VKKLLLVLLVGFGVSTAAFADHNGLGIGIVGGWGWPGHSYGGLSLKVPKLPVFWGIYPTFAGLHFGIGATGDYYFVDKAIVGPLHWFLGVGGFLNAWFGDSANLGLGLRVPIGLSWHIIKPIELFLDFAPGIGVSFNAGGVWGPYWAGALELGLRFWM
jgi:hypothetical protein